MKKKITALFLSIALLFSFSPLTSIAQEFINPFAVEDVARQNAIALSQQQFDCQMAPEEQNPGGTAQGDENIANGYNVQFKDTVNLNTIYQCVSNYPHKLLSDSKSRLFEISLSDISDFNNTYGNLIEYSGKSVKRTLDAIPNDPYYKDQWAIPDMNLLAAWDRTEGSSSVKVAVIDSGFYRNHEDLSNSTVLQGYNICAGTANVTSDEIGHGTMVTSVIAATTNNTIGMAGACWNVSVIPYKVANSDGTINSSDVITAIRMAADAGCDVINLSLGGYDRDPAEQSAMDYATQKGCIIVASSGNEGQSSNANCGKLSYPASEEGVISAASVNQYNEHSDFSQHNNMVDVCAPGETILVAYPSGTDAYALASGTSFSSPYVAAVAALARSKDRSITAKYFEQLIKETSTDLGTASRDDDYGWGLINADKLVQEAVNPVICGVDDNGIYNTAKTITFNKGTGKLNGTAFTSGSTVSKDGSYTLVVTDGSGNSTTVHFVIEQNPPTVSGIEDGKSYNTSRTITFNKGSATLNGAPFASGMTVSNEGSYTLVVTSPYGNTATYHFVIDKTAPIVTGVTEGTAYNVAVTITFNEGMGTLNGNSIQSGYTVYTKGSYTLVVTDAAGNATTVHFSLTATSGPSKVCMNTQLTQWVVDEQSNTLYAISNFEHSLLCINIQTLNTDRAVSLDGAPTDIILDSGKLYIALDSVNKIAVYNISTKMIEKTYSTATDPCRIVKDGNNIFYVQDDQWCELHELNLDTSADRHITSVSDLYQPDIAVNAELHMLYLGESGLSGSNMYYYSITDDKVISQTNYEKGYGYPYSDRTVLFDGKNVFYAGRNFSPNSATKALGDYNGNQTVLFAKYGCVFTNSAVYDEDTHVKAGDFKTPINLTEASNTGSLYLYDKNNSCITKINCPSGKLNANEIIAQAAGTPTAAIPSVTQSQQTGARELTLPMSSELTRWAEDEGSNMLFAVSQKDKALFFIDAPTLNIVKALRFTSGPTDIEIDNGKLYIPLDDANQIAVVNIGTQSIEKILYTSSDPYHVALDGDKLYYTTWDQWCNIYEYNLTTNTDTVLGNDSGTAIMVSEPDLAVNKVSHVLYIGESGSTGSKLLYYSTVQKKIIGTSAEYENFKRYTLFDGSYVYFCGRVFDPADPSKVIATLSTNSSESFLLAKHSLIYSNYSCYSNNGTFSKIKDFASPVSLVELSGNLDLFEYDKTKAAVLRESSAPIDPVVSISITSMPDKLTYTKGSQLDTTGMAVSATYADGISREVTGWTTQYDFSTAGNKTVTVSYGGKSTSFSVTVVDYVPGDISGDGTVNSKDITALRRYLSGGQSTPINTAAADVNKDGVVNSKDVTLLRRYIAGWNVILS